MTRSRARYFSFCAHGEDGRVTDHISRPPGPAGEDGRSSVLRPGNHSEPGSDLLDLDGALGGVHDQIKRGVVVDVGGVP